MSADARSRRVVAVMHCILNQNARGIDIPIKGMRDDERQTVEEDCAWLDQKLSAGS